MPRHYSHAAFLSRLSTAGTSSTLSDAQRHQCSQSLLGMGKAQSRDALLRGRVRASVYDIAVFTAWHASRERYARCILQKPRQPSARGAPRDRCSCPGVHTLLKSASRRVPVQLIEYPTLVAALQSHQHEIKSTPPPCKHANASLYITACPDVPVRVRCVASRRSLSTPFSLTLQRSPHLTSFFHRRIIQLILFTACSHQAYLECNAHAQVQSRQVAR